MQEIHSAVDKYRDLILEAEKTIWRTPETGYKEYKTHAYLLEEFRKLGYEPREAEGITGFTVDVKMENEGPTVLILGELDSVICPSHPEADPETGAVHACGHHAQCAALLGIAAALTEPSVRQGLSGRVRLAAVPAEELIEIEYRTRLKKEGKIRYFGGKLEFLSRGLFDGVDLCMMVHTSSCFAITRGMAGLLAKRVTYLGKSAHAGGSPWDGVNALYAANCGIGAVNAIRETFRDEEMIRVHPILTHGGDIVNAIPERVSLESYVRGRSFEAIASANRRVNRALVGAALSLGAQIEIEDTAGYSPMENDDGMRSVAEDAFRLLFPKEPLYVNESVSSGSTDMGDLSQLFPTVHPWSGGAVGAGHGADYRIASAERATVMTAKWQVGALKLLLENGAARGREIVANFTPKFVSKEALFAYIATLESQGERIEYKEGAATARV